MVGIRMAPLSTERLFFWHGGEHTAEAKNRRMETPIPPIPYYQNLLLFVACLLVPYPDLLIANNL